jgi:Domain of unknown function (DUF4331)
MSSHREAPGTSKDPVIDSTDVYAFVSPDNPETVTILANYVPLQDPAAGPNFFEFGDDVLYEINIDNNGDGVPELTYQFAFATTTVDPNTFLYNTSTITAPAPGSTTYANWNRPQTYSVTLVDAAGTATVLGSGLPCPPCNIGPRSTPGYPALSAAAVRRLSSGEIVFAGQRAEGFFVDLGSIFDLGGLRPLNSHHLIPLATMAGINSLASKNVHTIAIQVPITKLTAGNTVPTGPTAANAVIGVYTTAYRQTVKMINAGMGTATGSGPWLQVSRLGMPLVNEVVVPVSLKDYFNSQAPAKDAQFAAAVANPELAQLIPVLYPGAFPNLAAYQKAGMTRPDITAIFLSGIPASILPSAPTNVGGTVLAEMLRLNVAVAPVTPADKGYSALGVIGGDIGGFPNGRRLQDDVVTIELQALAGATIPLVDKSFTPDAVVSSVSDGAPSEPSCYQASFPYLADPHDGYDNPSSTPYAVADSK